MLTYTKENLIDKVEYSITHWDELKEVAKNGMELIRSKHSSKIRSKQFINNICEIVNKSLEFPDTKPCSYQVNFRLSIKAKNYDRKINKKVGILEYKKPIKFTIKKKNPLMGSSIVPNTSWRDRIK